MRRCIAFLLFVTAGGAALAEAAPEDSAAAEKAAEDTGETLPANRAYCENITGRTRTSGCSRPGRNTGAGRSSAPPNGTR